MSYLSTDGQTAWAGNGVHGAEYAGYANMMQQHSTHAQYDAVGAAAAAAASAASAAPASLQPAVAPKQLENALSYAAVREAAAVNQAADCASQDALQAIAAAQQTMHAVLNPDPALGMDGSYGGADEGGPSRRRNNSRADHSGAAALLGVGHGAAVPSGRPNKGLRHFSMKVCEKVESKGTTSYNEVADELVAELKDGTLEDGICYDEKNIRRRVYDAINVLMALDIIAKEKKTIIWKGFPTSRSAAQQLQRLQGEQYSVLTEITRKATYLSELVEQQKALKHLLDRNSRHPDASASGTALHLPFILVQSKPDATVEVQISKDMQDVQFNFYNYPFEIHDDALVLKKMLEHEEIQQRMAAGAAAAAAAAAAGASGGDPVMAAATLVEAAQSKQQPVQQQGQDEQEQQQQQQQQAQQQQAEVKLEQHQPHLDQQQQQQQAQQEKGASQPQGSDVAGQRQSPEQHNSAAVDQHIQRPAAAAVGRAEVHTEQVDDPMRS